MIILEGPDCSGKSTLMERFPDHLEKHHFSHEEDKLKRYLRFLSDCSPRAVLDRFHLSEQVYGRVMRNRNEFVYTGRFIERVLLTHDSCVILCLPPLGAVLTRWRERLGEEMVQDERTMRRIYESYTSLHTYLPVYLYDYTKDSVDDIIGKAMRHSPQRKWGTWGVTKPDSVLLVGEQTSSREQYSVPFTRPGVGCSTWLARQLEDAGIPENRLCWTNVMPGLTPVELEGIKKVGFKSIIALGNVASAELKKLGVSHLRTYHPQYWKRFHHSQPYPLIDLLKNKV